MVPRMPGVSTSKGNVIVSGSVREGPEDDGELETVARSEILVRTELVACTGLKVENVAPPRLA